MFAAQGQVSPEQVPDVVKKVFDSYRAVLGITEKAFALLKSPNLTHMSRSEFLATVEAWDAQLKEHVANTPLRAK